MSEKKVRYFFLDAEDTQRFLPIETLLASEDGFLDIKDGQYARILIKRIDMTDEKFDNLTDEGL